VHNSQLAVAVHEAGHAVAQLSNPPHPQIRSVSIVGLDPALLGLVDTDAMWQPYMATLEVEQSTGEAWRALAWKDTIFYLAGPIAELRWRRHSRIAIAFGAKQFAEECFGTPAPEGSTDFGRVRARLNWAYPGEQREAFSKAWFEAEAVVARHWRAVVRLGRIIAERGRINGDELSVEWERSNR